MHFIKAWALRSGFILMSEVSIEYMCHQHVLIGDVAFRGTIKNPAYNFKNTYSSREYQHMSWNAVKLMYVFLSKRRALWKSSRFMDEFNTKKSMLWDKTAQKQVEMDNGPNKSAVQSPRESGLFDQTAIDFGQCSTTITVLKQKFTCWQPWHNIGQPA